jgi:hypothetical protein
VYGGGGSSAALLKAGEGYPARELSCSRLACSADWSSKVEARFLRMQSMQTNIKSANSSFNAGVVRIVFSGVCEPDASLLDWENMIETSRPSETRSARGENEE